MTDDTTPEGGQRELCAHCGGNGVVKLVGGVSVCPRCRGECYEPGCSRCAAQSSRLRSLEQRLRDLEGYVRQAACAHETRLGGNDYLVLCNDCGLVWDYRREGPADALRRAAAALLIDQG
jgi:hypothetical protein